MNICNNSFVAVVLCCSNKSIVVNNVSNVRIRGRVGVVVCMGMLAPRKRKKKKEGFEVFRDAADEADQKSWRRLMTEIQETGSAVAVLKQLNVSNQGISRDKVLGTLLRFKQLNKWKLVIEVSIYYL